MAEQSKDTYRSESAESATLLPVGMDAPDFTLNAGPSQSHSLRDFRGKAVVLVFYPADWSPVCGDQLALYNELHDQWDGLNAQLIGISVDGVWCHQAYSTSRHLHFPLLADFEPKGAASRTYRAYRSKGGTSERALYVVDAAGIIRWNYLSPAGVNPGADGILKALESMTPEQRGQGSNAPAQQASQGEARA